MKLLQTGSHTPIALSRYVSFFQNFFPYNFPPKFDPLGFFYNLYEKTIKKITILHINLVNHCLQVLWTNCSNKIYLSQLRPIHPYKKMTDLITQLNINIFFKHATILKLPFFTLKHLFGKKNDTTLTPIDVLLMN